jgi:fibronectin-binding autotransporter adhesin
MQRSKFIVARSIATVCAAAFLGMSSAKAANLFWDGGSVAIETNGDGLSDGTAGNWDPALATLTNWDQGAGLAHVAWTNLNLDTAVFGGTAGTVTLDNDVTVGGITFQTTGYTLDGATNSKTLTFGAADNTVFLRGVATATGPLMVAGNNLIFTAASLNPAGTVNFTGATSGGWSGTTTVNRGVTVSVTGGVLNQTLLNTSDISLNGGAITITNIANDANGTADRIKDTANITSNGGTFTWGSSNADGTYAETIGSVSLAKGQTNFVLNGSLLTGSQTLTINGLSRGTNTGVVTFSAPGGAANFTAAGANRIRVLGATVDTPAGEIVGPWATVGSGFGTQTDYAVYRSDGAYGSIVPANIDGSDETTWSNSANAYTNAVSAVALTGNRIMAALRNTGATATITLSDSIVGYTLATNGILNGVASQLTIAPGTVAGAVTAPGTAGGIIDVNTGGSRFFGNTTNNNTINSNLSILISAPINDNGGPVTLVKSGDNSVLSLTSTTSNYSGGTVVNAGILFVSGDAVLGAAGSKITLNGGQLRFAANNLTFNRVVEVGPTGGFIAPVGNQPNINFTGKLTGSGTLYMNDTAGAGPRGVLFNSTENDITGAIHIPSNDSKMTVNSLADSPGAGDLVYYKGSAGNAAEFAFGTGAAAPLVFTNRSIQIVNNTGTTFSNAIFSNNNPTHAITVNSDVIGVGATAKTFTLNAVAGPNNVIAGKIRNDAHGGALGITKGGVGNWTLSSGGNTFTGPITLNSTTTTAGILSYASAGGPNAIIFNQTTSNATLAYIGSSPITMSGLISATALTTGGITLSASGTDPAATVNYSNSASLSTTPTNTGTRFITLNGTNTGDNIFNGAIANNNTGLASLTKDGTGKWVLSGLSTYTGATFVQNGTLSINSIADSGTPSAIGAGSVFTLGSDSNDATLIYTGTGAITNRTLRLGTPSNRPGTGGGTILSNGTGGLAFTAPNFINSQTGIVNTRTLTLGGSYLGANEIQGVIADQTAGTGIVSLTKVGAATWNLSGINTYTGPTTVTGGTLLVTGSISGSTTTVSGTGILGGGTPLTPGVTGNVIVTDGGTIAPGQGIGQLNTGTLTLSGTAKFALEIESSFFASDLVATSGVLALDLGNSVALTVSDLAPAAITGGVFPFINYTPGGWNGGLFNVGGIIIEDQDNTFAVNGNFYQIDYDFGGSSVALVAVPEPTTAGLLGAMALGLLSSRSRRRNRSGQA